MELVFGIKKIEKQLPRCITTIGNFDGLHLGHRQIIDKVIKESRENNQVAAAYTFFPHPQILFNKNFKIISTLEQKVNYFRETGIDLLIIEPFTEEFASLDADLFIREILINKLNCSKVIIGYDFSFGKKGKGNGNLLSKYREFTTEIIDPISVQGQVVHSTLLRNCLIEGDTKQYFNLTGRYPCITGTVISGKGMGNKLGFATANIFFPSNITRPKKGVYLIKGFIDHKEYFGIANIGIKPTIGENRFNAEIHFFNFSENIYGKKIEVDLMEFLREEKKFDNVSALVKQVNFDIRDAKNRMSVKSREPHTETF